MAARCATVSSATTATLLVPRAPATSSSAASRVAVANGLPPLRMSRLVCSAQKNEGVPSVPVWAASGASFAAFAATNPGAAFALVDERLSTEGTGLSLGLSNAKLGWILVGVTAFIWALYFVYSSGLPEGDDDSGLSL